MSGGGLRRSSAVVESAREAVRCGLAGVNGRLGAQELPRLDIAGKLIRPVLSWGGRLDAGRTAGDDSVAGGVSPSDRSRPDSAFWSGAAAVQMAHEASLLHDDILDDASERRGRSTVASRDGFKRALVQGDHLLTCAYRLAAATESHEFTALFARSVERTVAGEKAQAASAGRHLDMAEYEAIVAGKSGELLGCALAVAPALRGGERVHERFELGRRIGVAYQMLDDLLDYVPDSPTGKAPWQDYVHRCWTWPLASLPGWDFDAPVADVARALYEPRPRGSIMQRSLHALETRIEGLRNDVGRVLEGDVVPSLLDDWIVTAREAVEPACRGVPASRSGRTRCGAAPVTDAAKAALTRRLASERWSGAMRRYARSFSFAARLFPPAQRQRVADVYAVCRFTDEIADSGGNAGAALAELDEWLELCRRAFAGDLTGIGFVDRAMRDARESGVPFACLEELVEGMRMDLRNERYESLADLERYTYRVASVVGIWMTRMFGVHHPAVLGRAAALGRAMQLTNIARDVGEDLARGRIYIPRRLLERHGLNAADVQAMADGAPLRPGWEDAMQELLDVADREYARAFHAMPDLPTSFARPVAVAATVYRGIHDALRANGFDNFRHRAHTSLPRKLRLACAGLLRLRRVRRRRHETQPLSPGLRTREPAEEVPSSSHRVVGACLAFVLLTPVVATAQDMRDRSNEEQRIEMPARDLADRLAALDHALRTDSARPDLAWDRLGVLWLMGVDDEDAVRTGLAHVDSLEVVPEWTPEASATARLRAYRGAFLALLGKHAFWPHHKLDHVKDGLAHLDGAVAAAPMDPRIRYLRLMSGFYLPGLFGRGNEVRADFDALADILPTSHEAFPPAIYIEVVRFVLDEADLTERQRAALEAATST